MSSIKLNLGAGYDHRAGYINCDIDIRTSPDIALDLQAGLPFKKSSVSKILMQDVLEHVTKEQAEILLENVRLILKKEGELTIRIPNVEQIMTQFEDDPEVMFEFIYGNTAKNGVWGAHKYGYNRQTIKKVLKAAGFTDVVVIEETTNFLITAKKASVIPEPNVLVIQQAPDWGGAEEWISTVVERLRESDISVMGYTNLPTLRQRWEKSGAQVKNIPYILDIIGNWKGLLKSLIRLPQAFIFYLKILLEARKNGRNIIIMSGFSEKLLVTWLAELFKIPVVWYEYGPLQEVFKRNFYLPKILYRILNDDPELVITLSENTRKKLIPQARISSAILKVISPGVLVPNQRAKLDDVTVGCLARVCEEKGQRRLIRLWPKVLESVPEARLKIAGKGPDLEVLKQMVIDLKIQNSVEILGFVEDKDAFYKGLDVFAFAGDWELEGFGLVLIEAMSFGIPPVVLDKKPMSEVVGDSGIVCRDDEDMAEQIITLLKNQSLKKLIGEAARDRVIGNFNLETQSKILLKELQKVVNYSSL